MTNEIFEKITNHPVFISIVSILTVAFSVLLIVSKTSWGKKAIAAINVVVDLIKKKAESAFEIARETQETVKEINDVVKQEKEELESKTKVLFLQFEYFETSMYKIIEQIPNAKVQDELLKFKGGWEIKKAELAQIAGLAYSEIESKNHAIELELEKKNAEVNDLQKQINEIKDQYKGLIAKVEGEEHGREETINSQGTEETTQEVGSTR